MTGWDELDRFLQTDPRDVGCDQVLRILHVYVELVLDDESGTEAARRYPDVAAHLLSCDPCAEDYQGLLLAALQGSETLPLSLTCNVAAELVTVQVGRAPATCAGSPRARATTGGKD